jgi:hypothetical protein
MMNPQQFNVLQELLWSAYGLAFTWWLILFTVGGILLAVLIFFLSLVRAWLDRS